MRNHIKNGILCDCSNTISNETLACSGGVAVKKQDRLRNMQEYKRGESLIRQNETNANAPIWRSKIGSLVRTVIEDIRHIYIM